MSENVRKCPIGAELLNETALLRPTSSERFRKVPIPAEHLSEPAI
jgi:hypothetical protein